GRRLARVGARGEDQRPQEAGEPPGAGRVQMDAVGVEPVLALACTVPVPYHNLRPASRLGPDRRIDVAVVVAHLVQVRPDDVLDALADQRFDHRLHVSRVLVDVVVVAHVDDDDRPELTFPGGTHDVQHGRRPYSLVWTAHLNEPSA